MVSHGSLKTLNVSSALVLADAYRNVISPPSPATFTQDSKYNVYSSTGCSFGDGGASAKVYVYYQGTFHLDFQIQEWNENGIKLSLDPNLKGVNDHDNLTLI